MKTYNKKLIYDYIMGNDIEGFDIDELENNPEFMIEVIKYTQDKKMYNFCSDNVKSNYSFVKFMVEMFKEDIEFVTSLTLSYLEKTDEEDITYKELLVLVSGLQGDNNNLLKLKLKREIFKTIDLGTIELTIDEESNPKTKQELGMGFIFIIDNYGNSEVLKKFFAEEFILKIFKHNNITLEELMHKTVKSFDVVQNQGINTFLINFIKKYDSFLADYICNHIDLLDDIKRQIIIIGNNWDKYIERVNIRRFNILSQEMYRYMDENSLIISFNIYELLLHIMKNNNLEDLFRKYNQIPEELINITSRIDENKMNLPELKFFKYVCDLVDELFAEDVINKQEIKNTKKVYNEYPKILKFNTNTK